MGGSDGGIIVQRAVHDTLTDPLVHGNLPPKWPAIVDPILARDPSTWTAKEKKDLAACFTWALTNL
jgi:hypothetical protein